MKKNPQALATAQDDEESFEVMLAPPKDFDMYNSRPVSAGYNKARKQVHKDHDWHRSVHVWILDPSSTTRDVKGQQGEGGGQLQGRLVLQKRSPQKDTYPNRWDISSAGHIEASSGESEEKDEDISRATAIREVQEELGLLDITADELIFAFTCPAEQANMGGCNCYEDVYFLIRNQDSCNFLPGEAEVTDIDWFDVQSLKDSWDKEDVNFVPRVEHYKVAFFHKINELLLRVEADSSNDNKK